jgi:hypothetical protein
VRALLADQTAYELVSYQDEDEAPAAFRWQEQPA